MSLKKGVINIFLQCTITLETQDEISILIQGNKIDVIVINETKLDEKIAYDTIAIDDFILKRLDRNRHCGGVTIYIRETLNFEHRVREISRLFSFG